MKELEMQNPNVILLMNVYIVVFGAPVLKENVGSSLGYCGTTSAYCSISKGCQSEFSDCH